MPAKIIMEPSLLKNPTFQRTFNAIFSWWKIDFNYHVFDAVVVDINFKVKNTSMNENTLTG